MGRGGLTVVHAWMPGIRRIPGLVPGGILTGGAPRAVWTTTESDPTAVSAASAAYRLAERSRGAHLVWNPSLGEIVQLLPATAAALGQLTSEDAPDRGTDGRTCVVVLVVGYSHLPFTDGPLNGLAPIMHWLDSWGVGRDWPVGPPVPLGDVTLNGGGERYWAQGGHFAHSQVPNATTTAPGAVHPDVILGHTAPARPATTARVPTVRPRRAPVHTNNGVTNGTVRVTADRESVHV